MKYNVHRYEVYRARVDNVEADNPVEAIKNAEGVAPEEFEFAEDYTGFVVDEADDEEYENTTCYYPNDVLDVGQRLYFISDETDNGDSLDAFIWARNRTEAVELWQRWDMVADYGKRSPRQVFLIPLDPRTPGLLGWHVDVKEVH